MLFIVAVLFFIFSSTRFFKTVVGSLTAFSSVHVCVLHYRVKRVTHASFQRAGVAFPQDPSTSRKPPSTPSPARAPAVNEHSTAPAFSLEGADITAAVGQREARRRRGTNRSTVNGLQDSHRVHASRTSQIPATMTHVASDEQSRRKAAAIEVAEVLGMRKGWGDG